MLCQPIPLVLDWKHKQAHVQSCIMLMEVECVEKDFELTTQHWMLSGQQSTDLLAKASNMTCMLIVYCIRGAVASTDKHKSIWYLCLMIYQNEPWKHKRCSQERAEVLLMDRQLFGDYTSLICNITTRMYDFVPDLLFWMSADQFFSSSDQTR